MGYQQSLRPCEGGLALNVDGSCTAFLEELPVPEFLARAAGVFNVEQLANAGDLQKKKCSKAMVGIKVTSSCFLLSSLKTYILILSSLCKPDFCFSPELDSCKRY